MPQKKQSVYSKIADNLVSKIIGGEYAVGSMLPPERVLMEMYKVERTTIRRGLEILSREGYIKKVAGLGSVIVSKSAVPVQEQDSSDLSAVYQKAAEKSGNVKSILALFPDNKNSGSPAGSVIEHLKAVCRKNSAKLTVLTSSDTGEILDTLRKTKADSCAVFFGASETVTDLLIGEGIRICFVFCKVNGFRCILPDIHCSCGEAAEYLCSLGHETAAFIGGDEDSFLEREFRLGFSDEFTKRNPESDIKQYTNTGGSDEKSGFERLSELIRRAGGKFTAVAAINDEVAAGAVKAAKYYRLSVPQDLSVISLCSINEDAQTDRIYSNPRHIAMEIYNCCACISEDGYGVTCMCGYDFISGKTSGKARNSASSGRRLSDFLL